jgi:hypothetical protein
MALRKSRYMFDFFTLYYETFYFPIQTFGELFFYPEHILILIDIIAGHLFGNPFVPHADG